MPTNAPDALLKLMHIADSAFPIGASAHSFGLETLTAEGIVTAPALEGFLTDLLWETGRLEGCFVRWAYRCVTVAEIEATDPLPDRDRWLTLNQQLSAFKSARESREASATLGRRFLQTLAHIEQSSPLQQLYTVASQQGVPIHYCTAFGLVSRVVGVAESAAVLAYLQQTSMGLVSAALRLLPIGQGRAVELLWRLKTTVATVTAATEQLVAASGSDPAPDAFFLCDPTLSTFTPLLDLASMRHPTLSTRLFIS